MQFIFRYYDPDNNLQTLYTEVVDDIISAMVAVQDGYIDPLTLEVHSEFHDVTFTFPESCIPYDVPPSSYSDVFTPEMFISNTEV